MGRSSDEAGRRPRTAAARGEAELQWARPRLEAITPERIVQPNVDLQDAALVALGVARLVSDAEMRRRFEALASIREFDMKHLDTLGRIAWASWYVKHRLLLAAGTASDALLPETLAQDSLSTRTRMRKTIAYHLGDNPRIARMLQFLALGAGYRDLANDLIGYAHLYAEYEETIRDDKKNYRASDREHALHLAGEILEHLAGGTGSEQAQWSELQARAWTLLTETYEEIRRCGLFLVYHNPEAERLFPSLVTASRERTAQRSDTREEPVPDDPDEPDEPEPSK